MIWSVLKCIFSIPYSDYLFIMQEVYFTMLTLFYSLCIQFLISFPWESTPPNSSPLRPDLTLTSLTSPHPDLTWPNLSHPLLPHNPHLWLAILTLTSTFISTPSLTPPSLTQNPPLTHYPKTLTTSSPYNPPPPTLCHPTPSPDLTELTSPNS